MTKLVLFGATLVFSALFQAVSAIGICGLEWLPRCDPYNKSCIITSMEPGIRRWFAHGRPEYFEDPVDPFFYEEVVIPVKDGVYSLRKVSIRGIGNSQLVDWIFDVGTNGVGFMGYTYNLNLLVRAETVYRSHGQNQPVLIGGPLITRIGNVKASSKLPLWFMTRCDGEEYMAMKGDDVCVEQANDNIVSFECGGPSLPDAEVLQKGIVQTVGGFASGILTEGFRTFCTQIGVNGYFDFRPHYEAVARATASASAVATAENYAHKYSRYG